MASTLHNLISELREEAVIKSQFQFDSIARIDKYSINDYEIAYLLGYFFKHRLDTDALPSETKDYLILKIKERQLGDYFYCANVGVHANLHTKAVCEDANGSQEIFVIYQSLDPSTSSGFVALFSCRLSFYLAPW
jgi:hypothetical protein